MENASSDPTIAALATILRAAFVVAPDCTRRLISKTTDAAIQLLQSQTTAQAGNVHPAPQRNDDLAPVVSRAPRAPRRWGPPVADAPGSAEIARPQTGRTALVPTQGPTIQVPPRNFHRRAERLAIEPSVLNFNPSRDFHPGYNAALVFDLVGSLVSERENNPVFVGAPYAVSRDTFNAKVTAQWGHLLHTIQSQMALQDTLSGRDENLPGLPQPSATVLQVITLSVTFSQDDDFDMGFGGTAIVRVGYKEGHLFPFSRERIVVLGNDIIAAARDNVHTWQTTFAAHCFGYVQGKRPPKRVYKHLATDYFWPIEAQAPSV